MQAYLQTHVVVFRVILPVYKFSLASTNINYTKTVRHMLKIESLP